MYQSLLCHWLIAPIIYRITRDYIVPAKKYINADPE